MTRTPRAPGWRTPCSALRNWLCWPLPQQVARKPSGRRAGGSETAKSGGFASTAPLRSAQAIISAKPKLPKSLIRRSPRSVDTHSRADEESAFAWYAPAPVDGPTPPVSVSCVSECTADDPRDRAGMCSLTPGRNGTRASMPGYRIAPGPVRVQPVSEKSPAEVQLMSPGRTAGRLP